MSYLYSLRFAVDPGFTDERSLEELPGFIAAAAIDDVMVFANVEELNTGHTDESERVVFSDLARRTEAIARSAGATMSLNPWHTIMHGDYGKRLRDGQDFRLMVDPNGREAELTVCPLDPEWLDYLCGLYAFYARTHPRLLWLEDDFRYHNHWPLEWGGCFCDAHLAEFSRRAGRPLQRAEFISGLLAPGRPHEFRRIWLETAAETLEQAAAAVGEAVRTVSPETSMGLMSSVPAVHAAEGRRWTALLTALGGGEPAAVRLHLPSYVERRPAEYLMLLHSVSDLNRALLPAGTAVYPELENFPYSRFSTSLTFTRFQLLTAQVLDPAGMTIDLFDLNGNGPVIAEGYQQVLAQTKPYLERGRDSGVFAAQRTGVTVLVSEASAAALQTGAGRSMTELYPREGWLGALLGGYGVPFRYSTALPPAGGVVAVTGQYFRNLSEAAIRELLAEHRAILDAEAVDTLVELGLGDLVGARSVTWFDSDCGAVTYEEAEAGTVLLGRERARASVLLMGADVGVVDYAGDRAVSLTRLRAAAHRDAGPGHVVVDDRVLVIPFARMDPLEPVPPMLRTTMRQELLQGVVRGWAPELPMSSGVPDLVTYAFDTADGLALYLVNGALDEVAPLRLWVGTRTVTTVYADPSAGSPGPVDFTCHDGVCTIALSLPALETVLLRLG
jgi:hypothetical protein